MRREKHAGVFGLAIAAAAALAFWLLHRKGLLHEQVSSRIITPQGTITSDTETGAAQFASNDDRTYNDADFARAVPSLCAPHCGGIASCPTGTELWKDIVTGKFWCFPAQGS